MAGLRKPSKKEQEQQEVKPLDKMDHDELDAFANENDIEFSNAKLNKSEKVAEIQANLEQNEESSEDENSSEDASTESDSTEEKSSSDSDVEVQTSSKEKPKKQQPKTKIKMNKSIRTNIGGEWYDLKEGKTYTVPKSVKDILQRAGFLQAI